MWYAVGYLTWAWWLAYLEEYLTWRRNPCLADLQSLYIVSLLTDRNSGVRERGRRARGGMAYEESALKGRREERLKKKEIWTSSEGGGRHDGGLILVSLQMPSSVYLSQLSAWDEMFAL